jgi:hypothetical protein
MPLSNKLKMPYFSLDHVKEDFIVGVRQNWPWGFHFTVLKKFLLCLGQKKLNYLVEKLPTIFKLFKSQLVYAVANSQKIIDNLTVKPIT